ncbi:MAG: hypothetical protein ACKPKO_09335, partial [Candidatus Fonsibacter sp.]
MVTHLKVKGYIPYLVPGMPDCQPQKPRGKNQFCCSSLHAGSTFHTYLVMNLFLKHWEKATSCLRVTYYLMMIRPLLDGPLVKRPTVCTICLPISLKIPIAILAVEQNMKEKRKYAGSYQNKA